MPLTGSPRFRRLSRTHQRIGSTCASFPLGYRSPCGRCIAAPAASAAEAPDERAPNALPRRSIMKRAAEIRGRTARRRAGGAQPRAPSAYPNSVCGVVPGPERVTRCVTFTCDGSMSAAIEPYAWERARRIAAALGGEVYRPVGLAPIIIRPRSALSGAEPGPQAVVGAHISIDRPGQRRHARRLQSGPADEPEGAASASARAPGAVHAAMPLVEWSSVPCCSARSAARARPPLPPARAARHRAGPRPPPPAVIPRMRVARGGGAGRGEVIPRRLAPIAERLRHVHSPPPSRSGRSATVRATRITGDSLLPRAASLRPPAPAIGGRAPRRGDRVEQVRRRPRRWCGCRAPRSGGSAVAGGGDAARPAPSPRSAAAAPDRRRRPARHGNSVEQRPGHAPDNLPRSAARARRPERDRRWPQRHDSSPRPAGPGRKGDMGVGAATWTRPVSSGWRSESSTCAGIGQLVEDEHAEMGEADLARRAPSQAAADQGRHRGAVVRRAIGGADRRRRWPGDRGDHRHFERFRTASAAAGSPAGRRRARTCPRPAARSSADCGRPPRRSRARAWPSPAPSPERDRPNAPPLAASRRERQIAAAQVVEQGDQIGRGRSPRRRRPGRLRPCAAGQIRPSLARPRRASPSSTPGDGAIRPSRPTSPTATAERLPVDRPHRRSISSGAIGKS